jgi:hypothetical protein
MALRSRAMTKIEPGDELKAERQQAAVQEPEHKKTAIKPRPFQRRRYLTYSPTLFSDIGHFLIEKPGRNLFAENITQIPSFIFGAATYRNVNEGSWYGCLAVGILMWGMCGWVGERLQGRTTKEIFTRPDDEPAPSVRRAR